MITDCTHMYIPADFISVFINSNQNVSDGETKILHWYLISKTLGFSFD